MRAHSRRTDVSMSQQEIKEESTIHTATRRDDDYDDLKGES